MDVRPDKSVSCGMPCGCVNSGQAVSASTRCRSAGNCGKSLKPACIYERVIQSPREIYGMLCSIVRIFFLPAEAGTSLESTQDSHAFFCYMEMFQVLWPVAWGPRLPNAAFASNSIQPCQFRPGRTHNWKTLCQAFTPHDPQVLQQQVVFLVVGLIRKCMCEDVRVPSD